MRGICDRCMKESWHLQAFPFRYKMMGDPQADRDGYVQYWGCRRCIWEDENRKNAPKEMKP